MSEEDILYCVPLKDGGFASMTIKQIHMNLNKIAGVRPAKEPETVSREEEAEISKGDGAEQEKTV